MTPPLDAEALRDGDPEALAALHEGDPARRQEAREFLAVDQLLRLVLGGDDFAARVVAAGRDAAFPRRVQAAARSRRRRPARRWRLAAAALILAALGTAVWMERTSPPIALWSATIAGTGHALAPGETLAAATATTLRLGDGTALDLEAGGELTLEAAPDDAGRGTWRLRLRRGALAAAVTPQPAERGLAIATDRAVVEVVGTRFALVADAAETRLTVAEGRVRLRVAGTSTVLAAGASATVSAGGVRCREVLYHAAFDAGGEGWEGRWDGAVPGAHGGALAAIEHPDRTGSYAGCRYIPERGWRVAWRPELSVTLRYRTRGGSDVHLQLWHEETARNLVAWLPDTGDAWRELSIPVADMRPYDAPSPAPTPGGHFVRVVLVAGPPEAAGWIDDLRIERAWSLTPAP